MSEARAVTNFSGNAIACLLVATWTKEIDREQLDAVLAGDRPFDEATMLDDIEPPPLAEHPVGGAAEPHLPPPVPTARP